MRKSTRHASSIGLIRNLKTRFISHQFHVVYDNAFQIVMGGCDSNETVVNHIWDNLAGDLEAIDNIVDQDTVGQNGQRVEPIPNFILSG